MLPKRPGRAVCRAAVALVWEMLSAEMPGGEGAIQGNAGQSRAGTFVNITRGTCLSWINKQK